METPEIIIFYLDLEAKILKKKDIVKTIESFIKRKIEKVPTSTFSAFYFKENDEPFQTDETQDPKILIDKIDQDWKERKTSESFFENGLFYCLSSLAQKAVSQAGVYRIIVLSDTASQKDSSYAEALMGLVETVRNFPTFIDIIRIGTEDMYPDDVKLRIISTITSGGLFYVENSKEFNMTFIGLAKNKTLPDLRPEGGQEIDEEKKSYYEKIAKKLSLITPNPMNICTLCNHPSCEYCSDPEDISKCPDCGTIYHSCCAALYSWGNNIGLKHIFRCNNCQVILSLDEKLVYQLNGESYVEKVHADEDVWKPKETTDSIEINEIKDEQDEISSEDKISSKKGDDLLHIPEIALAEISQKKDAEQLEEKQHLKKVKPVKMGLFGPTVGTASKKQENKAKDSTPLVKIEGKTSEPMGRSSLTRRTRRSPAEDTIRICKVCSQRIPEDRRICPNCGSPAY